jgi:hypothetical protein
MKQAWQWVLVVAMGVLLYVLGYETLRIENVKVQILFAGLFAAWLAYCWLNARVQSLSWKGVFFAGLILRLILFVQQPNLSDDYLRYTWDGHLQSEQVDPFEHTPQLYVALHPDDSLTRQIMEHNDQGIRLNSRRFYSVYTTPYQLIFYAADAWGNDPNGVNLWIIRAFLLLFECLTFWVLWKLLNVLSKPLNRIALYWLNPLVIVEFIGNLHFDGIALFFMLLSFWFLATARTLPSALALGMAIATKINPVFMAMVARRNFTLKQWLLWGTLAGLTAIVVLALYFDGHNLYHVRWSYRLYLYAFHFNSCVLNGIRGVFGPYAMEVMMGIFPKLIFLAIVALNFLRKHWQLSDRILLAFTIYYLFGTTVHPWYLVVLVPFALLSDWKFPLVWTYLIVWTYSFYHLEAVRQIGWVVGLEYALLIAVIYFDFRKMQRKSEEGSLVK